MVIIVVIIVVIRGYQRSSLCSSEVISGHQRSSVVIHALEPSSSYVIRGHQWSSAIISILEHVEGQPVVHAAVASLQPIAVTVSANQGCHQWSSVAALWQPERLGEHSP